MIERRIEDDLFAGVAAASPADVDLGDENHEVSARRAVEELVAEYNQIVRIGQDTIVAYFRNYRKIGKYIGFNEKADERSSFNSRADLTARVQHHVNEMLNAARTDFWRRTLELPEVTRRLTKDKREKFDHEITKRCNMDFTSRNIRQFILNLMGGFEKTLEEAVVELFDKFTIRHCYSDGLYDENIHYFNGWKTNRAFKVNRRIVIPIRGSYGLPFRDWGKWKLNWQAGETLRDIDIVMSYFDGMNPHYLSMAKAIEQAFERGQSSRIRSTYFTITCYKKGTAHLAFNDEDILRRFNVVACKGKNFLPHDYGTKAYNEMPQEEQEAVNSFEGPMSYVQNFGKPLISARPNLLQITEGKG